MTEYYDIMVGTDLSIQYWLFVVSASRHLDWKDYIVRENATAAPVTCFKHVCIKYS